MYDVITIGDAVNDIFIKPCSTHFCSMQINLRDDRLWMRHGDKISIDEIHYCIGGSAANVAVGLSRLGFKTAIIGAIGDDLVAKEIQKKLSIEYVNTQWLKSYKKTMSSTAVIVVFKGERTIFVYRGLRDYSQVKIPHNLHTRWIYLGPVAKDFSTNYNRLISLVCEKNIQLALNPGNRQILEGRSELIKLLKVTKLLILNKQEALDLTSLPNLTENNKLLKVLNSYGPQIVVVTDGGNGAFATGGQNLYGIESYDVKKIIDPTGAGDAFSSGFLASYIENNDLGEALRWGITNSAMILEKYGAQTNLQNRTQLEKLVSGAPRLYKL